MRFSTFAMAALSGAVSAAPYPGEQEALAAKAMVSISEHIAQNGYSNPKCTLKNAAVRREW